MAPILQTPRTLRLRILLRFLLLRQMPLAIRHDAAHVVDIVLVVFIRVLVGVLLEDGDDFAAAGGNGLVRWAGASVVGG